MNKIWEGKGFSQKLKPFVVNDNDRKSHFHNQKLSKVKGGNMGSLGLIQVLKMLIFILFGCCPSKTKHKMKYCDINEQFTKR